MAPGSTSRGVLSVIRDGNGTLTGYVQTFHDLTARHRLQDRLALRELRYQALVESMGDRAIFAINPHGLTARGADDRDAGRTSNSGRPVVIE